MTPDEQKALRVRIEAENDRANCLAAELTRLTKDYPDCLVMSAFGKTMTERFTASKGFLPAYALGTALMKTVNGFVFSDDPQPQ